MADVSGRFAQLQPDLVGALQRLRPVVVVVADVDALAQGRKLDLHAAQAVAQCGLGFRGDRRIALGPLEHHLARRPAVGQRLRARQGRLGLHAPSLGRGNLAPELGGAGLELVDAAGLKGARLDGEPVVQGLEIVAPGDLDLVLALELIDEPDEIVEPAALGARIDDADEHRTGLKLGSDRYRPQRPDLAFDRRAQGDQPRVDDGFGAGRFQERAHRQPAGRHDDDEANRGLEQPAMLRPELLCEFRAYLAGRLDLGVRLHPRLERLAEHGDAAYRIQAGERRSCLGVGLARRIDLDGQPIRGRRHGFAVGESIARTQSRRAAHVPHRRKT